MLRDKYVPGGQMWVTESGDAGGGGDTWASTYLDVLRTLNELGGFSAVTDGIIFHNTLASSNYGWLRHGTFDPRPNYYAVLLWNRLMGTTVYDCGSPAKRCAYLLSLPQRRQGGRCLSDHQQLSVGVHFVIHSKEADRYTLSAESPRADIMRLNGNELRLSSDQNPRRSRRQTAGRNGRTGTRYLHVSGCCNISL